MTTAMVDFVTRVVGWKVEARYNALSYDVGVSGTAAGATRASEPFRI